MPEMRCPYCLFKYVSGKWKMEILLNLKDGELRMSELEHRIPKANPRVLTRQLRCLEKDGIVGRRIYTEVPPKVEYSLTEYGKDMMNLFNMINQFTQKYLDTHKNKV
jgi:DNA-binding HxlR family transcriptional regulator